MSIGTGLIALEMAEAIAAGNSYEEVVAVGENAIPRTRIYVYVESLDAALRGGRLTLNRKKIIDFLKLNPVLTVSEKGKVELDGVTFGNRNVLGKFENYVLKKAKGRTIKRIGVAHADHVQVAGGMLDRLRQRFPNAESYMGQVCPALGAHAGHHAIGIALQFKD